ncbi:hypothetical protein BDZ97DRAFT_1904550 [Flammula alnicola]|nr:hypothetical protein BDZ97DRAFT_1904550 [Flammula alnicola]
MVAISLFYAFISVVGVLGTPLIYDGRAPFNYTESDFNNSVDPYLTVVVSIDNSSIFLPGGTNPQSGFRRTDIIAQNNFSPSNLVPLMETNVTSLNYNHEYQMVFIEPNDGSHVFGIQLGIFTNPTGALPAPNAHSSKVLDHALNVLFLTPFTSGIWHNIAIKVDRNNRTLAMLFSKDAQRLTAVTKTVPNLTTVSGTSGQGEFHFGVLKTLPANRGDVVHHGIQEGTTERLLYSRVFVEGIQDGISVGEDHTIKAISS